MTARAGLARQHNGPENPARGRPLHDGRLLQLLGDGVEVALHHPHAEGNGSGGVDDDEAQPRVAQPQPLHEDDVERNEHQRAGEHLRHEEGHHARALPGELEAAEGVGGGAGQEDAQHGGGQGHRGAVEHPVAEGLVRHHRHEVGEGPRFWPRRHRAQPVHQAGVLRERGDGQALLAGEGHRDDPEDGVEGEEGEAQQDDVQGQVRDTLAARAGHQTASVARDIRFCTRL